MLAEINSEVKIELYWNKKTIKTNIIGSFKITPVNEFFASKPEIILKIYINKLSSFFLLNIKDKLFLFETAILPLRLLRKYHFKCEYWSFKILINWPFEIIIENIIDKSIISIISKFKRTKEIIIERKIMAWSPNFEESNTKVARIIAREYFIKIGKGDKTTIKKKFTPISEIILGENELSRGPIEILENHIGQVIYKVPAKKLNSQFIEILCIITTIVIQ